MSAKKHIPWWAGALASAYLAASLPAGAGTVPYAESFESYANGSAITNVSGWTGADAAAGVVTNDAAALTALAAYTNAGHALPLPSATHTQVLAVSSRDGVANAVSSATGGVVLADYLARPTAVTKLPAGSNAWQYALCLNTSTQLVIWRRSLSPATNDWLALTNTPAVADAAWLRIQVAHDYARHLFQVRVNGTAIEDAQGYAAGGGSQPGSWFHMAQTNGALARFRVRGVGHLDDLVFTNRSVSYDGTTFAEAPANNGAIATTRTLTLYGDTFVNASYAAGTHFSTSGVPAGLGVALAYQNPTQVVMSLTGNASPHTDAANTAGLGLTLLDGMFTLGAAADVAGRARTDLAVTFNNPPVVSYAPTAFTESEANNGSIGNTITLALTGDTFTNTTPLIANTHYTVNGVPAGLGFKLERPDATHLTATLTNQATSHGSAASTNLTLTLLSPAFETVAAADITGAVTNLAVTFFDTPQLTYTPDNFTETAANDGTVNGGTIQLAVKAFAGADGTNYVTGGAVTVTNVPAGLTVAIVRTNAQQAVLSFGGAATSHESANSISNLTVVFHDGAFATGNAAGVLGYSNGALRVTFANRPALAYSPTTFTETNRNDGGIGNEVRITLAGASFASGPFEAGTHYTTSGVPAGLSFSLSLDSATQLTARATGQALEHANANDTSMTLALLGPAFQNVAPTNIAGSSTNLAFDFNNQPVIGYSRTVFTELSGGAIDNLTPMSISIGGDTFTGSDGENFVTAGKIVATNVPTGLTAVITRSSATNLNATLTGAATAHANSNDVDNLTFVFQDSAIALAAANQAVNYSNGTLQVDFSDSALAVNTVPYRESFEPYADGFAMGAAQGWAPDGAGVVTKETAVVAALAGYGGDYPLATNHAQVLRAQAPVGGEIRSAADGTVYVDFMVYATARASAPAGSTNHQIAVYVTTNQHLAVWHRDTSVVPASNTWLTLDAVTVATGVWHRVTFRQDYAAHKFRVHLDGSRAPVANPTSGDTWFNMVGTANRRMSRLRVEDVSSSAPGYLEDLVVDTQMPASLFLSPGAVFTFR